MTPFSHANLMLKPNNFINRLSSVILFYSFERKRTLNNKRDVCDVKIKRRKYSALNNAVCEDCGRSMTATLDLARNAITAEHLGDTVTRVRGCPVGRRSR